MDGSTFLVAIQRRAPGAQVADPLGIARAYLEAADHTQQGDLFRRMLHTLATGDGEYRENDLDLFGNNIVLLASSVIAAHASGAYPSASWDEFR